jgi:uncharacterized protein YjbI with pentapeptide repeats
MSPVSIFLIALAFALAFMVICYSLPIFILRWRFKITNKETRAELEDTYRKTTAQILGGAAIVLGFAWTWIKDHETLQQAKAQLANQQFAEAVKLLASVDKDSKLAGIYPLQNVVITNNDYYLPVLLILQTYIKTHQVSAGSDGARPNHAPEDVIAAVFVLGHLPVNDVKLELIDLNLSGANFSGPGLQGVIFRNTSVYGGNFTWAQLKGATFDNVHMADWESYGRNEWKDDLAKDPNWQNWEKYRYIANFEHADLSGATFINTSVTGAKFAAANLTKAAFENVNIGRADFTGAVGLDTMSLYNVCYEGADARPAGLPEPIAAKVKPTCH